ncbi:Hsp20/alpha crystallin family protein [Flavobacterium sp. MFBS3-15]|uniref:Hsp20/alpha crystallin family protein n=1 Tax=Flavobacterium sp. MFBS3-15 TaxID=2989816 RepID=UPI0022364DD9|nr:Hsp20/alpha crystallin family protein [Flavobacterium sp. MFBS3-15]MCW4467451.1 Hsp20/alpha crystallin family protein [Flavobacterium sp. MFBS3-15]
MNLAKRNTANRAFPTVMDELFKDLLGGTQYVHKAVPPVNIRETEGAFTVELMAAGMKKEDFNLEIDNDLLTISAEVKAENTEENGKFTRREFSFTSFKRSFTLPETVKEDDINAVYEDGILKITLPKKEEALPKAKRLIEIS